MAAETEIKLAYPLETAEGGRLESVILKRLTVANLEKRLTSARQS